MPTKVFKHVFVFALLFSVSGFKAQSAKFFETWNFAESQMKNIDSLCNEVKREKLHLKRLSSKVKVYYTKFPSIKYKIVSHYSSGNNVQRLTYKGGGGKKIKVIQVNGKIMAIHIKWTNVSSGHSIKSQFTRMDDDTWFWTLEEENVNRLTEVKVETVNNWPK